MSVSGLGGGETRGQLPQVVGQLPQPRDVARLSLHQLADLLDELLRARLLVHGHASARAWISRSTW